MAALATASSKFVTGPASCDQHHVTPRVIEPASKKVDRHGLRVPEQKWGVAGE